jgi:Lon protease-like protein
VLYPGGPLPLRIFEARYLDMISGCLKDESPFGVLLIKQGAEAGPATTYDLGTLARISDWYQGSDGLLGVTAVGERRFRLLATERQKDGLNIGDVEVLGEEPHVPLPDHFKPLAEILEGVLDSLGKLYDSLDKDYTDAGWLSYRFAEILPISTEAKQEYLSIEDPVERLERISSSLKTLRSSGGGKKGA